MADSIQKVLFDIPVYDKETGEVKQLLYPVVIPQAVIMDENGSTLDTVLSEIWKTIEDSAKHSGAGLYITYENILPAGEESDGRYPITIFEPDGISNGDNVLSPSGMLYPVTIVDGDVNEDGVQMVTVHEGEISLKGPASTVSVGRVEKLPAGSDLKITNTGTESNAILNFGIPAMDTIRVGESYQSGVNRTLFFEVKSVITKDPTSTFNSGIGTAKIGSARIII